MSVSREAEVKMAVEGVARPAATDAVAGENMTERHAGIAPGALQDLLWETVHAITGATGRGNNLAFAQLYIEICGLVAPKVAFEIGAREANFSRELKRRCPGTECYAFEANPYIFEQFRNKLEGVVYVNEAIGAEAGAKPFFIPLAVPRTQGQFKLTKTNPTSSLKLRIGQGVEYESVACKCDTLDAWHERLGWPSSALWIDVEGAVGDVIAGAERAIRSCVQCVFVELEKAAGWKDQWLAPDVTATLHKFGFHALARDSETQWQYNQIFVREGVVTREILQRVGNYLDRLVANTAAPSQAVDTATPVPDLSSQPRTHPAQPAMTQYPDRSAQVMWLLGQKLLSKQEAEHLLRSFHLPKDFDRRVLAGNSGADAVSSVAGVESNVVIPASGAMRLEPPYRTFDGPYPRDLAGSIVRYPAAELHVARTGKVFVGLKQTTLMLDRKSYYHNVSKPTSRWITPAFAEAPGELRLRGTAAILFANGATHFSHWMFDLLPKIEVLRRAGWVDRNIDHYIVNGFRSGYQKESIDRLGIPHHKVVPVSGMAVSADTMLIPSDLRMNFRTPPWICEFVRSVFLKDSGRVKRPDHQRLHISRARARCRRILNLEEIEPVLEKFGFRNIFAEDMTIAQCAELVCEAQEIFAPHGAGATNAVFGLPGIRLLESYSAHIAPEGWLLTQSLGGQHYIVAGQDSDGRFPWEGAYAGFSERDRNYADYMVRPDDLERALEILTTR